MNKRYLDSALFAASMIFVLTFFSEITFAQLVPISLEQRIDKSDIIFEGRVTSKTSFWDQAHQQIYTTNTITVYKVFKGNLISSTVEIVTRGGMVGHTLEEVSHSLQLTVGDTGIFTAIPNQLALSGVAVLPRFRAYAGIQGFIRYDLQKHTASDPFSLYKNIANDVYTPISKRTKAKMRIIRKTDFTIQ